MQMSLHQISLEFLRIFGNGKLGLTLGLEFLGILSFTILQAYELLLISGNRKIQANWAWNSLEFLGIQLRDV